MSESVERFYARRWRIYDLMIGATGHRFSLKRFFLARNILKSGMRVLDAGCGSGALTRALLDIAKGKNLTEIQFCGFDLTGEMLNRFKQWLAGNNIKNVNLFKADVLELPDNNLEKMDLIVTAGMLEYLPVNQLADGLRCLRERLKERGSIFVFISRYNFLNKILIGRLWRANLYTQQQLVAAFSGAGFENITVKPFRSWGFVVEAGI